MAKKKYKRGKPVKSMADFEKAKCDYFIVYFGCTNPQTKHRAFLISWQYRTLLGFIENGFVFEAEKITNGQGETVAPSEEEALAERAVTALVSISETLDKLLKTQKDLLRMIQRRE